jgi:FkbM family methyltransferase
VLRATARRILGIPDYSLPKPYDFVQADVEQNLNLHLGRTPDEIGTIVIVGAWHGREVVRMLERFPAAHFFCFEPNPQDFAVLESRFDGIERVTCFPLAASDAGGTTTFYEVDRPGTSSLFPPDPDDERLPLLGAFEVESVRLDDLPELRTARIDCLWVDVQGAESKVLSGGLQLLARTDALFLEVALHRSAYVGGTTLDELRSLLEPAGFSLHGLGLGHGGVEGNSLWLRTPEARANTAGAATASAAKA